MGHPFYLTTEIDPYDLAKSLHKYKSDPYMAVTVGLDFRFPIPILGPPPLGVSLTLAATQGDLYSV